ncbi:MAG: hypothetical protein R3181_06150 [Rubricoccaceae bacterium]|nr:hypothetical protein [Rubricoccaceae bacterium]
MGQLALILTLGALLIGGIVLLNVQHSTDEADETTTAYQVDRFAREAALVGLEQAERRLNADPDGWASFTVNPDSARALFGVPATTVDGATYEVRLDSIIMGSGAADPDQAWLTATGSYDGWDPGHDATGTTTFSVVAKYEKGYTDQGVPPAMRHAIVTDLSIDMRGNAYISGSIHTNGSLSASGGAFDVLGNATYTGDADGVSRHQLDQFQGGIGYQDSIHIPPVTVPPASLNHQIDGDHELNAGNDPLAALVDGWYGVTGFGTEDDPYVLYINGNLTLDGTVRLIGFSRIYVNGTVLVQDNAQLTPTSTATPSTNGTPEATAPLVEAWIENNLPNGSQTALYATGDITVRGTPFIAANLYTNGSVRYVGGGNKVVIGGVTARGDLEINGNPMIFYTDPNASIVDPGMDRDVPEGLRLIAYREWAQRPSDPTP